VSDAETQSQPGKPHATGFFAAVRVVALLTLVSRVAGLARDVTLARVFGDTAIGSAFAFAFLIPNLFRRLFGEGALTAAFLPEYASLSNTDRDAADRFASLTAALLTVITGAITVVGIVALLLIREASPDNPDRAFMLTLAAIMLPYMPLVCAVAIVGAILQVHGRFAPMASAPVLLNAVMIAVALLVYGPLGYNATSTAFIVAVAVVVSGALQLAWTLLAARPFIRWTRGYDAVRDSARRMMRRFIPGVLGLGTLQLNTLLDGVIAAWPVLVGPVVFGIAYPLDEASNAILSYTQRLYQFPLGVFGIAVATAVFPLLSRVADSPRDFVDTLRRGLRLSIFIGLPASAGLVLIRDDLTFVLLQGENFSIDGARRAALVLAGYAPAVWAYSVNQLFVRAFYARGDTLTPVKIAVSTMLLNLALNASLIWVPGLRESALAWSTAISATVQTLWLARLTRTRLLDEPILNHDAKRALARIALLTLAMSAVVFAIVALFPAPRVGDETLTHPRALARLAAAVLAGGAVFGALAWITHAPELRWLLRRSAR
jgi:putative peptidoglycan lipid II flippase